MKNTIIKNISALKDSFVLIKHEYGKKEEPSDKHLNIGSIKNFIKENLCLSVSRSSDIVQFYKSEYGREIETDHFGRPFIPHELILRRK